MNTGITNSIRSIALCASLVVSMTACSSLPGQQAKAPAVPEVEIEFTGTAFKVPENVPGGIVAITVNNTGAKPMDITVGRLRPGFASEQAAAWLRGTPDDALGVLRYIRLVATFDAAQPGTPMRMVADLKTGDFVLDAAETVMGQPLPRMSHIVDTFKAGAIVGTHEPSSTVTAQMHDFAVVLPDEVKAGKQTWKVTNTGKQWHMMVIAKPKPGVSPDEALNAFMAETPAGPPPFEIADIVAPMSEGEQVWVDVDLQPGVYLVVCTLTNLSGSDNPPMSHAAHGMHKLLTVK